MHYMVHKNSRYEKYLKFTRSVSVLPSLVVVCLNGAMGREAANV